jgi:hypothetical protein
MRALLACLCLVACNREPLPSGSSSSAPPDWASGVRRDLGTAPPVDLARGDLEWIDDFPLPDLRRRDFAMDDLAKGDLAAPWCGGASCGPSQYCEGDFAGVPDHPYYECREAPAGCGGTPSCDCIEFPQPVCSCAAASGRVVVTCAAP